MGKVKKFIVELGGQLSKSFTGSFSSANSQMKQLQETSKKLASQEKLLKTFEKNTIATKKNAQMMQEYRNRQTAAAEALRKLGPISEHNSKMAKKLELAHTKAGMKVEYFKAQMLKNSSAVKSNILDMQKLGVNTRNYGNELSKVQKNLQKTRNMQKGMNLGAKHVNTLKSKGKEAIGKGAQMAGYGVVAAGAGAVYGSLSSINTYMGLEKQLKMVKSISGATEAEYKQLESASIKFGATTSFTSEQATAGMGKFALAGFKTKQIIDAMPGVLAVAAASGEDMVVIADIVSDNLLPFKLEAKDTSHFTDVLANTMSRTNVNIGMLGESLKYVSGDASSLGLGLEMTTAALGLMGDQAIKSGQAGRNLKAAFSNLADSKVQKELRKMGITVKDGLTNEFVGMVPLIEQLEKKTSKMTGIQRLAFLKKTFGEQGALAIDKLLTAEKEFNGVKLKGAAALKAMEAENINSKGKAEAMAKEQLKGLEGAKVLFLSAFDSLQVSFGKIFNNPIVIAGITKITNFIGELGNSLRGEFSDNTLGNFFKTLFRDLRNFGTVFSIVFEPIKDTFKELFMPNGVTAQGINDFIKNSLEKIMEIFKIMRPLIIGVLHAVSMVLKIISFIGADNIIVFAGVIATGLEIIKKLKDLKEFISIVKAAGGALGYIKAVIAALGGPITLIIAALVTVGYILHKNGGILNNLKAIVGVVFEYFKLAIEWVTLPFSTLFLLVSSFFESWDSSKGILENFSAVWDNFLGKMIEKFKGLIEKFKGIWEAVKNIPIIKNFFGGKEREKQPTPTPIPPKPTGPDLSKNTPVAFEKNLVNLAKNEKNIIKEDELKPTSPLLDRVKDLKKTETNQNITKNTASNSIIIEKGSINVNYYAKEGIQESKEKIVEDLAEQVYKRFLEKVEKQGRTTFA